MASFWVGGSVCLDWLKQRARKHKFGPYGRGRGWERNVKVEAKHTFAKLFVLRPVADATLDAAIVGQIADAAADSCKPAATCSRAIKGRFDCVAKALRRRRQ